MSFYFSWKLTLLILGFLPFIALSGGFQAKMLTGFAKQDKHAMEAAGRVRYHCLYRSNLVYEYCSCGVFKLGVDNDCQVRGIIPKILVNSQLEGDISSLIY